MPKDEEPESETSTESRCRICGGALTSSRWNTVTDITYCDNINCELFHTPVRKHAKTYAERNIMRMTTKARIERMRDILLYGTPTDNKPEED